MDLMSQFNQLVEPFFEIQRFMDFYGVEVEDFKKHEPKSFLEDPMYTVKFSIPEFEECDGTETRPQLSHDEIKHTFKKCFNEAMAYMWKMDDDDFDDEFIEFCLTKFVYMCRIRKGETWSVRQRVDKLVETEAKIQEAKEKFKRETEYDEV